MEVTATAEHDAVVVDVDDPRAAAGDRTGACVLVRIQPEEPARVATSEAYACWNPTLGSAATVVAMSPATAEVGCATTLERDPADDGSPTTEASGNGPSGNVPGTAAPPSTMTSSGASIVVGVVGVGGASAASIASTTALPRSATITTGGSSRCFAPDHIA